MLYWRTRSRGKDSRHSNGSPKRIPLRPTLLTCGKISLPSFWASWFFQQTMSLFWRKSRIRRTLRADKRQIKSLWGAVCPPARRANPPRVFHGIYCHAEFWTHHYIIVCASVCFIVSHGGLIAALHTSCYLLSLCFCFWVASKIVSAMSEASKIVSATSKIVRTF